MDFSFLRVFAMFFAVVLSNSVLAAPNGTSEGRSRHHKAFFGDEDESRETKGIFPDSDETSSEFKFNRDGYQPTETVDEEKAIDAIVAATRTGRQLNLDEIDEEQLNHVISDPAIKKHLAAGNEGEARGIIRDKLCALGLMACSGHHKKPHYGRPHRYKPRPQIHHSPPPVPHHTPHYGQGVGHLHGGSIPARDVSLVQPVAVQPVGGPISAVPLQSSYSHSKPYLNTPVSPPRPQYSGGYSKTSYGAPPLRPNYNSHSSAPAYSPPKQIYPSRPVYSEPITKPIIPVEKKVVEVVHHHVHHKATGGRPLANEAYSEYGVIGTQFGGEDSGYYGAAQKQVVSVATPGGKDLGSFAQPQTLKPNYLGVPAHARTCICVPIEQCILDGQEKSSELEVLGSHGTEVIQGTGVPNSGLVGYGIDPRNKGRSLGIESNATDDESGSAETDQSETSTVLPEYESVVNSTVRRRREARLNGTTVESPITGRRNGKAQPRRLDSGHGCRIRSIGSICCDPSRIRNPLQRQIPVSQQTSPIPSNSFNQHVLYNPNGLGSTAPFYGQCGKRNAQGGIHGRVITAAANSLTDGDTDFGEYPWQVAILKKDGTFVCGGSLIDGSHVLTAAHGIKHMKASDLRVRLGEWDVNHNTEFYPHFERQVTRLTIHPDFYAGNLMNDIAVLRFEGGVDFRQFPHVSPVCLAPKGTSTAGRRCYVTGWGKDAFGKGGKYQNVLKEIDLPILSNFDCEQKLRRTRLGPDFVLNPGFLCAGGEAGKDACKGDGGGPLVCEMQSGSWAQVGIVSWGVGCGERNVPGVYVAVEHYQPWIHQVTATF